VPAVIPVTSASSGKEMWHPAGGSLVRTDTGASSHTAPHQPQQRSDQDWEDCCDGEPSKNQGTELVGSADPISV